MVRSFLLTIATLLLTIAWLCDLEGFCFCAPTCESGPVFNTVMNCSLITWHRSLWTQYTTVMSCKGVLLIFYCQNTPHKIFTNNMYLLKICITWCTALFYSKKKCITRLLCICDMHVCPWSHRGKNHHYQIHLLCDTLSSTSLSQCQLFNTKT